MDEENTEYIKLPVTDRCVHKSWKARVHGYTEAAKIFQQIDDEKSPEWNKFLGLVKKFVIDSNAVAQEKGLEAVLAFVENSAVSGKTVGEVMSGIVAKCIGAPKAKTKELAAQITLMYIEQEKQELVIEELLKGTEHKNPKVVCGCINVITQAIREFGVKVINVKPLVKKIPSLLEDRDKGVRDEGKAMVVEMHRWIGPALAPQLSALKPVQMTELETEFAKAQGEKATPTRWLRSQQARQAKQAAEQAADDADAGDDEEEVDGQDIDPYELMEPVNILAKLPKDFYEKVEAKKWQERKEAMETLETILKSAPKLENGDYFELVKVLKKLISKDSNVVVVALATKNMGGLASGLKKRFTQYASTCIPILLEKFREKKANVVTALRETIDAVYQSTTLEAVQEDVLAALDNKNPSVKAETALFLARCFQRCTTLILTKKLLKVYTAALCKTLNEPDPTVRDNSAEALGTAMKVVSEKAITPFLENVDSLKLAKIKECSEKAEILVKQPTVKPAAAAAKTAAPAAKPGAGSTAPKAVKRPASAAAASKTSKAAAGGGAPARKGAASNAGKGKSSAAKVVTERELSDEEVQEKAEGILSPEILNGLADSNWKTRLAVMEQFTQTLGTLEPGSVSSQVLLKILNRKPGIKDTNFQVAKLKLEAVKMIATTFPVTSVGVNCILLDVVDKMNEVKTSTIASECLTELSEATNLEAVSTEVLDYSMNRQKSPKVQVEVFNWLSTALLEFGFQVNAKALMENVKKGVAATSQVVRTAAISLLGTLYVFMGPQLHFFFENEKPALVQQINAECDKRSGETAPVPVRGLLRRAKSQDLLEEGGAGDYATEDDCRPVATPCIQDIVPRTDITGFITDALVSELQDKNWKVRSEAIIKLQNIINELRFVSGSLGEAAPLLGARLVDSNSKISQNAIALCESLATASGTAGCKQYVRHVFPGLLQCTGDSKAWIRTAAVACINTYGELCGYKEFFEGEMIYDALKGGSPALRTEVWSWLSVKLPNMKTVPKEELLVCLPILFANLEDRNPDVRKNASEALVGFMYHLGYSPLMSACDKLKPASSLQIRSLLDKARCLVPEKPTAASKAKGAGSSQAVNSAGAQGKAKLAPGSSATITKSSTKLKTANAAKSTSAGSRKEEEVDVTPLLPINNQKNQRVIDEQKLKTLKWNFTTPRDEFVELLRDQMTAAGVNKALIANMFHADFKYHLKAIDQLNEDLGSNLQSLACNLDLILRWMTLRFFDTNPSVILKGLEYLQTAFNMLIEDDYIMLESEASAFIPYLVLKVGDPKDAVRNSVRGLFKQIVLMYPVSKMFTYIMDGLKSKNARQRSECLEQLGSLIETIGTTVCQPSASVALKEIAKHISDRDNSVRNGALNCIVAAYFLDGEKVLKTVGQISDKDMSLLEERIKRAAKNRPVAGIKPMPPQQQQLQQSRPASAVRPSTASPPLPEPVEEEVDEPPQPEPTPQKSDSSDQNLNSSGEYEPHCFRPVEVNTDIHDEDNDSSPRSQIQQPVTGPFSLDPAFLASIEVPVNIQRPKFEEVDLSFLREPVPQITRSLKLSSTSPLSKLAHPSTIEWQIQQIGSPNLETALTAMSQIETVLLSEKRNNLQDHVDKFVTQLVNQLIFLNQSNHPDIVSCYRLNFSLLMKLYYYPELSCKVTEGVIKDVIHQLISLLTEKKLEMYDSTEMFVKVVNCLVLRILERSEHTSSTCALLKLLYDTVNNDTILSYQELIMKCIWRVVKNIPEWDDVEELDYDRILPDIHTFLKDYPSHWWKKQPSDTPLRTVKTLLHTLVKMKGYDLLPHVKKVKGITPESEMSTYCNKLLRTLKVVDNAVSDGQEKKENCKPRRMPKSFRDQLSDIFIKIGSKTETKEGLRMLYEFKQQHPDADIQPFLEKSTKFFQDYIQRGLQAIEVEQRHNMGGGAPTRQPQHNYADNQSEKDSLKLNNRDLEEPAVASAGTGEELDDNPDLQQMQQFMKRLRVLQAKANLVPENNATAVTMATSQTPRSATPPSDSDILPSRKPVFDTIVNESPEKKSPDSKSMESLRQRLEKIKQGARLDTSS